MKRSWLPRVILCLSLTAFSRAAAVEPFLRATDPRTGWLTSLRCAPDTHRVEFLRAGQALGEVILRVRNPGAPWREVRQSTHGVALSSGIRPQGEALRWEVRVKNTGSETLELGDLALPLPMNTDFVWDHEETFQRHVFRHAFIAGHGSFLYWLPVKGSGPMLVMMPEGGTHLEFFTSEGMDYAFGKDRFTVFVHSKASAEMESRGAWRWTTTVLRASNPSRFRAPWIACRSPSEAVLPYRTKPRWPSRDCVLASTPSPPARSRSGFAPMESTRHASNSPSRLARRLRCDSSRSHPVPTAGSTTQNPPIRQWAPL